MSQASWPEEPYKGLSFYTPADVALFGGREGDIRDCAGLLTDESTKVLLLHGWTGCGKSSFLRAGLIPYLELRVPIFQFMPDFDINKTKALFIRCTEEPLLRLCETLYDWSEEPFSIEVGPDEPPLRIDMSAIRGAAPDRETFAKINGPSVANLMQVLRQLHELLPKWPILVIDQGEEVLTLKRGDDGKSARDLFCELITAFNKSSLSLKLVIALRTEYFGEFYNEMRRRRYDPDQLASFQLNELSDAELVEAIEAPTSHEILPRYLQGRSQPGDHYNFDFENKNLPQTIVANLKGIKNRGGVLPNLQATCIRLYRSAKPRKSSTGKTLEDHGQALRGAGESGATSRVLSGRDYSGENRREASQSEVRAAGRRARRLEGPALPARRGRARRRSTDQDYMQGQAQGNGRGGRL